MAALPKQWKIMNHDTLNDMALNYETEADALADARRRWPTMNHTFSNKKYKTVYLTPHVVRVHALFSDGRRAFEHCTFQSIPELRTKATSHDQRVFGDTATYVGNGVVNVYVSADEGVSQRKAKGMKIAKEATGFTESMSIATLLQFLNTQAQRIRVVTSASDAVVVRWDGIVGLEAMGPTYVRAIEALANRVKKEGKIPQYSAYQVVDWFAANCKRISFAATGDKKIAAALWPDGDDGDADHETRAYTTRMECLKELMFFSRVKPIPNDEEF
ncbi:DNA polymerase III alpha subunit [Burkholderia phage BcepSauron]|uniref:DNA polymerase III alpha subunit n=1 Tax=Burkholderia phage BcepSauron TaxID=2530033 RepID=A0A482MMT5_9CAUD|nr:DNA polymerase III alpha subunit [Burkholderia phage BcepSauron]QBQ74786.1 DNA polymerase III alpha subunit [Burkholderia phage BcepSauron]